MADEPKPPTDAPIILNDPLNARFDDWVRAVIVVMFVGQFVFMTCYALVMGKVIEQGVLTVLVGMVTSAIGYFIGTSSGSTAKSRIKGDG
jgi:hypothetical protein